MRRKSFIHVAQEQISGENKNKGDFEMRKSFLTILGAIALCCLCCFTSIASATKPGYTQTDGTGSLVIVDGVISSGEWDDCYRGALYNGMAMTNNSYRVKWAEASSNFWVDQWLFEILGDSTNDTGDYIQVCYDPNLDGGATPQADDYLINYTGHGTTAKLYKGTGSGWAAASDLELNVASSIRTTSSSATPHWVIEIAIENPWESTGDRVAAYDATSNTTLMWPPQTSANVPNDYGLSEISYEVVTIPEGLSLGAMVLLSTLTVLVGMRFFRKRPQIMN